MSDDDDAGDDIVEILSQLRREGQLMRQRLAHLERYLRDEGYGPDEVDDDDD